MALAEILPVATSGFNTTTNHNPPFVRRRTMRDVAVEVCQRHGVPMHELLADCRRRRVAHARQEFMALAYELPHTSDSMIAKFLGKDHTTCLYGRRAHWGRCGGAP